MSWTEEQILIERIAHAEGVRRALEAENAELNAVLHMTVSRLGGNVEGRPTIRLNFLQRIDELVEMEGKQIFAQQFFEEFEKVKQRAETAEHTVKLLQETQANHDWWCKRATALEATLAEREKEIERLKVMLREGRHRVD